MYNIYNYYYQSSEIQAEIDNSFINLKLERMFMLNLPKKQSTVEDILEKIYKKLTDYIMSNACLYIVSIHERYAQLIQLAKIHNCKIEDVQFLYLIDTGSDNKTDSYVNLISIYKELNCFQQKTKMILILVSLFYCIFNGYSSLDGLLYQYLLGLLHTTNPKQFELYNSKIKELLDDDTTNIFHKDFDIHK